LALYEGMFLLDNRQANRDWDASVAAVKKILSEHGAEASRMDKWAERKLAYPVKAQKRGTYLLAYFSAEKDAPSKIYRDVEISTGILRALILKIDELPAEPEKEEPKAEVVKAEEPKAETAEAVEEVAPVAETASPEAGEVSSEDEKGE